MGGKIKGMLFDIDDTLVNSRPSMEHALGEIAGALAEFATSHGFPSDFRQVRERLKELDERMHADFRYNRDEWWQEAVRRLWPGVDLPSGLATDLTHRYWSIVTKKSVLYPDAIPALDILKKEGYVLAAVTDTDGTKGVKLERIKKLNLIKFFNFVVVGGEDTEKMKPDPEPFLLASSRLGLDQRECVMVGDRPYTDIKGAKAAGMRTIWVKRREWNAVESCDAVVESLLEIPNVLVKI